MKHIKNKNMLAKLFSILCWSCLIFYFHYATGQLNYPLAAPETGEGFSDDFLILLEGAPGTTNILELDTQYNYGKVELEPWSNSYWPIYKGLIAHRFADSRTPETKSWQDYYNFYQYNPPANYLASGRIDELSPAEKYDLLIGDRDWTLTKKMWARGAESVQRHGRVATWTGICHGWAAASQIGLPTPTGKLTIPDVTGTYSITFYPFDIMALTSYLWAQPEHRSHFSGRRCRVGNPSQRNGRTEDGSCFDNNPMTWHLAATNRMGRMKQALIMDTSYGPEVWNYATDSYQVNYFNPATQEFSPNISESIVRLADFKHDPFAEFRSTSAVYIVGVVMDVFYPGAISPHKSTPAKQLLENKRFVYDLELNSNMEVVGGEWHINEHPDFLWIYPTALNPFQNPLSFDPDPLQPILTAEVASSAVTLSQNARVHEKIIYRLLNRSLRTPP